MRVKPRWQVQTIGVIVKVKCAQRKMALCQAAEFGFYIPAAIDKHVCNWVAF